MPWKILIVDDSSENRKVLASVLSNAGDYHLILSSSGEAVLDRFAKGIDDLPDLILLDIMMPDMDGFQVASRLKTIPGICDIPIIFVTGLTDTENIVKAFEHGGVDYVTKPFRRPELLARVKTHIRILEQQRLLENKKALLEAEVEEKTRKIEKMSITMVSALENANFYNDEDTGNHIKRVSRYSGIFAREYGCDQEMVKKIQLYASLHDIGKIGIPDDILKKTGKYTSEEFEVMKKHVEIGYRMIEGEEVDEVAKNIIRYHHEKWEGSGYLQGISGRSIPLEARIVALSDVYDALTTKRSYKEAFPEEMVDGIIEEASGKHFDPDLVEIFFRVKPSLQWVRKDIG